MNSREGVKLRYILPHNAILPKSRHNNTKYSRFYELLGKEQFREEW
jgi:hypothetical protein